MQSINEKKRDNKNDVNEEDKKKSASNYPHIIEAWHFMMMI